MSIAKSRTAYDDVFAKFELAMNDPRGVRIPFDSYSAAKTYMARMHNARAIDRRDNERTYQPDDPMYGQCIYDRLQCTIREGDDGTFFIYVEPRDKYVGDVESLSEIEADDEPIPTVAELANLAKAKANDT